MMDIWMEEEGKEDRLQRWMDSLNVDLREKGRKAIRCIMGLYRANLSHTSTPNRSWKRWVIHSRVCELFDDGNIVGSLLPSQNEPIEDETRHPSEDEVVQRAKHCHSGSGWNVRHSPGPHHHKN